MKRFNAYIDESGDNGFTWYENGTGSSRWFILGAIIVEEKQDLELSYIIDDIKERLSIPDRKPLHWVDRNHKQRKFIIESLIEKEFIFTTVVMDKFEIEDGSKLREYPALYLYTARFLLERISWYADNRNGIVNCVFEHRKNLSYPELRSYIRSQIVDTNSEIRPEVIDEIKAEEGWQYKNLQIADACVGSTFNAFEPNKFGQVEPAYLLNLKEKLYRCDDSILNYGLKVFPHQYRAIKTMDRLQWIEEVVA